MLKVHWATEEELHLSEAELWESQRGILKIWVRASSIDLNWDSVCLPIQALMYEYVWVIYLISQEEQTKPIWDK